MKNDSEALIVAIERSYNKCVIKVFSLFINYLFFMIVFVGHSDPKI